MSITPFTLQLKSAAMISPKVRHLAFERADGSPLPYKPGQFITIHFDKGGNTLRRSYSIATIPDQSSAIEIAAAAVEGGPATELLFNMTPGDTVQTTGPFGRLVLPDEDGPERYLLVATGTGVTPYRAMLPELARRIASAGVKAAILQGVQTREQCLYPEDFSNAANTSEALDFFACYSRENPNDPAPYEKTGYVQDILKSLSPNPEKDWVYLCGNPNMIDDTFAYLKTLGFPMQHVKREKYISAK